MNDFYRHKKSDKVKWIIASIAFVLVFVLIAGLCMQLFGTGKVKPSEWFTKTVCEHVYDEDGKCEKCGADKPEEDKPAEDKPADDEPDGDEKESGTIYVDPNSVVTSSLSFNIAPLSMDEADEEYEADENDEDYGITPFASTGYTVTATAYYANGEVALDEDQYFLFTLKWVNTNRSDAVSQYVDLQADDRTATVRYLSTFDTQIILECVHAFNSAIRGTATIDCARRVTSIITDFSEKIENNKVVPVTFAYEGTSMSSNWYMPKFNLINEVYYSIGTIDNSFTSCSAVIELTDEFKTALTARLSSFASAAAYKTSTKSWQSGPLSIKVSQQDLTTLLVGDNSVWTSANYMGIFKDVLNSTSNQVKITINLPLKYGGTWTITYYLNISFDVQVANLNMDNTSFIL